MNIAVLHHHLNRGGVTQVILNHLQALEKVLHDDEPLRVALIHGGRTGGIRNDQFSSLRSLDVSLQGLPALDYDDGTHVDDENLASEILAALNDAGFSPGETLLHIHNHSLGKNVSLPGALRRLAQAGYRLLLQIHDFAEDLRPANYRRLAEALGDDRGDPSSALYPQVAQIHYAVLNGRDYQLLKEAGLPSENLHRLPNAAGEFGQLPSKFLARQKLEARFGIRVDANYILYPVRGIRRKNVGEALLWAALAPENCFVGVTLAPQNPVEQQLYKHWKRLAKELALPCVFETGGENGLEFKENLAATDLLLTTSVAEGFGMVFLEAWLAGRNLAGRDLPEITADFVEAGIRLESLYPKLPVPIEWIGKTALRDSLAAALNHLLVSYAAGSSSQESIDDQLSSLLDTGEIDFAMLNSSQQSRVIRMAATDPTARAKLLDLNPRLRLAASAELDSQTTISANANVVREVFSLEASGSRLQEIYGRVIHSRVETEIRSLAHSRRILDSFLDVRRLHSIRFEE